jgi:hypothetical protein
MHIFTILFAEEQGTECTAYMTERETGKVAIVTVSILLGLLTVSGVIFLAWELCLHGKHHTEDLHVDCMERHLSHSWPDFYQDKVHKIKTVSVHF